MNPRSAPLPFPWYTHPVLAARLRMTVANKFALAFLACALVGMLLSSWLVVRREAEAIERTVERDLVVTARALAVAASDADAMRLAELERSSSFSVRWLSAEAATAALAGAEARSWTDEEGPRTVVFGTARIVSRDPRAVVVSTTVPTRGELLAIAAREEIVAAIVVIVATAILARILGEWLLARPLGRVIAHARRVGEGDLTSHLVVRGSAEIAALKAELNRMTDRLAESQERAERESRERIATLEQLRHVDRLRTVGTLASGIAHELGTPLNVILLRARMIERSSPEATASARVVVEQTERVSHIVRQLLDFARRRPPNRTSEDLSHLGSRVLDLLKPLAQKADVSLRLEPAEAPVTSLVDRGQIEQVVTNLVVNAVQASEPGGEVLVRVGAVERSAPTGEAGAPFIEVSNRGAGIDPADLERVFEPFFTTKEVGVGTGLGLSVAHGIVTDHGGTITARSSPEAGTVFRVVLAPAGRALAPEVASPREG